MPIPLGTLNDLKIDHVIAALILDAKSIPTW